MLLLLAVLPGDLPMSPSCGLAAAAAVQLSIMECGYVYAACVAVLA
jgi:hypothetical protein